MADFANDLSSRQRLEPETFLILNREPSDTVWEESVQYDAVGRVKVLQHLRATAPGRLLSETPRAGFIGPSGHPCREHLDGARPVWLWPVAP